MDSRNRIILSVLVSLLTSCRTMSNDSRSDMKHTFGSIGDAGELPISCENSAVDPEDQDYHAYLTDLLKFLIDANKDVLPANLKIENLCLSIEPNYKTNASASPTGEISATRGLLWLLDNDAQVAAALAHELSHAASIHGLAPNQDQALVKITEYVQACNRMREIFVEVLIKEEKSYKSALRSLIEFSDSLKNKDLENRLGIYWGVYKLLIPRVLETYGLDPSKTNQSTYTLITETPFDPAFKGSSSRLNRMTVLSSKIGEVVMMVQDYRLSLLESFTPEMRRTFESIEKSGIQHLERVTSGNLEFKQLSLVRRNYEKGTLGEEVAANWTEQAADEKGLELFIRAGFDPAEYLQMIKSIRDLDTPNGTVPVQYQIDLAGAFSSSNIEIANGLTCNLQEHANDNCERGDDKHPRPCWRLANIEREIELHKKEYATIMSEKPLKNILNDRFNKLQKRYFTKTLRESKATKK